VLLKIICYSEFQISHTLQVNSENISAKTLQSIIFSCNDSFCSFLVVALNFHIQIEKLFCCNDGQKWWCQKMTETVAPISKNAQLHGEWFLSRCFEKTFIFYVSLNWANKHYHFGTCKDSSKNTQNFHWPYERTNDGRGTSNDSTNHDRRPVTKFSHERSRKYTCGRNSIQKSFYYLQNVECLRPK